MKKVVFLLFLLSPSFFASATHLRSGHISVTRVGSMSSLTCRITVTVFTDTDSPVRFGGEQDILDFGDGTRMLVPETANTPYPGFIDVGIASYTVLHTYSGQARYTISYLEPNRNEGVLNMDNAVLTTFYVETMVDLDPLSGFYASPNFLVGPIFNGKLGSTLSISAGAVSENDYTLSYELGTPFRDRNLPVVNYQLPENIQINPFNGLITWDTKFHGQYVAGEYAFNIKVHVYKKIEDLYYEVCTVSRDIQIILDETSGDLLASSNTEFDENGRFYIPENGTRTIKVFYEKQNIPSDFELAAYSELEGNPSLFSFTTYDSSSAEHIKVGVLTITSDPSINRKNPYLIAVRGKHDMFANDMSFLFYTQDIQPEIIEVVTGSEDGQPPIEIYPNPSKDFLMISLRDNQRGLISIHDQTGNLVVTNHEIQGTSSVDIEQLTRGFYYGTLVSSGRTKKFKFMKN